MRRRQKTANLSEKANKILNGILFVLMLVAFKAWHLAVVQHEKKQEESKKPQRRTVIERSERASIYDRFNIPMATNKVQYNATICYGPIRDLPRWKWEKLPSGKRMKSQFRKAYISQLALKLSEELEMDPEGIEDVIHSKAAILGNVPCTIKENISEKQYFRLKMLEKDWPGIQGEISAKRCYPWGGVGGEIVGYIGPISRTEYDGITREMAHLRELLSQYEEREDSALDEMIQELRCRLDELEKKAYRINDFVGKIGVEATYDKELRGVRGKRVYLTDIRGNFLRELSGSEKPIPGNRITLTLSAELQAYAHQLLAEYESESFNSLSVIPENRPWIKGGAIIALDPNTGEIYAMASSPTFDPNDFIRPENDPESVEKNKRVNKWMENEKYLADIWDMKVPYTKEVFQAGYFEKSLELDWKTYLRCILPPCSEVRNVIEKKGSLMDAIYVQKVVDQLLSLFSDAELFVTPSQIFDLIYSSEESSTKSILTLKQKQFLSERYALVKNHVELFQRYLEPYFSSIALNYEKILLVDLYRLSVDAALFPDDLAELIGQKTLDDYREVTARFVSVASAAQQIIKEIFFETDFKQWREKEFSHYLAERRQEEKEANRKFARPYIEYLEICRQRQFQEFWQKYQWDFIALLLTGKRDLNEVSLMHYEKALKEWHREIQEGAHQGLDWVYHYHRLSAQTDELLFENLIDFLKTLRPFNQLKRPLLGQYHGLKGNHEKDLATAFYPSYGFGFARSQAFRQATTIGSIFKLVTAYEALRQRYHLLKERGESLTYLNPLTIIDDKHRVKGNTWNVGFTVDGRPIPMYYKGGRLPKSDHAGIGKIDLIRALEASSNPYFAMLAGDILDDPEDVCKAANLFGYGEKTGVDLPGEYAGRLPLDIAYNKSGLYSMTIGQHTLVGTPLQTAVMLALVVNGGSVLKPYVVKEEIAYDKKIEHEPSVRWRVFLPPQIQDVLFSGLKQVIMGQKGTARLVRRRFDATLVDQFIGKTSTSEVVEKMSLDGINGSVKLTHIWFGGISFESNDFSKPELVIIVYLRYGEWGKDAAPLAMEMVKKWRELKKKNA